MGLVRYPWSGAGGGRTERASLPLRETTVDQCFILQTFLRTVKEGQRTKPVRREYGSWNDSGPLRPRSSKKRISPIVADSSFVPSSQSVFGTLSIHCVMSGRVAEEGRMRNGKDGCRCSCVDIKFMTNVSPMPLIVEDDAWRARCAKKADPTDEGRSSGVEGEAGG